MNKANQDLLNPTRIPMLGLCNAPIAMCMTFTPNNLIQGNTKATACEAYTSRKSK